MSFHHHFATRVQVRAASFPCAAKGLVGPGSHVHTAMSDKGFRAPPFFQGSPAKEYISNPFTSSRRSCIPSTGSSHTSPCARAWRIYRPTFLLQRTNRWSFSSLHSPCAQNSCAPAHMNAHLLATRKSGTSITHLAVPWRPLPGSPASAPRSPQGLERKACRVKSSVLSDADATIRPGIISSP